MNVRIVEADAVTWGLPPEAQKVPVRWHDQSDGNPGASEPGRISEIYSCGNNSVVG